MVMRVGVIGHPIGHSLSPIMHNRWIDRYGLEADYKAVDGQGEEQFEGIVRQLMDDGWLGLNVTIPFKGLAVEIADSVSPVAKRLGAANFLHFRKGQIQAENFDVVGFRDSVRQSSWDGPRNVAMVLGAGGAAPAIVDALHTLGFGRIDIANRTFSRSATLAEKFNNVRPLEWSQRSNNLQDVDMLVNATSLGMKGQPPLDMPLANLPPHAAVIDIVTTPLETRLLSDARARNLFAQNGIPMLVHQAIPAFETWFGYRPHDIDDTIQVLENAIKDPA